MLAVILLVLVADRLIFTSSGIKIKLEPEVLKASNNSELEINVYRSNLLGFGVPFGKVDVRFVIVEGTNLVEIIGESADGKAKIRAKGIEGEAVIGIYDIKSGMLISRVMIKIMPGNFTLGCCDFLF